MRRICSEPKLTRCHQSSGERWDVRSEFANIAGPSHHVTTPASSGAAYGLQPAPQRIKGSHLLGSPQWSNTQRIIFIMASVLPPDFYSPIFSALSDRDDLSVAVGEESQLIVTRTDEPSIARFTLPCCSASSTQLLPTTVPFRASSKRRREPLL